MTGRLLRLTLIFLLLFAANADAETAVPVIVKLPGANLSLISTLLKTVPVDSIPGTNIYLFRAGVLPQIGIWPHRHPAGGAGTLADE